MHNRPIKTAMSTLALAACMGVTGTSLGLNIAGAAAAASPASFRATTATNIRSAPTTSSSLVTKIAAGTTLTGTVGTGGWLKITSPASLAGRYVASFVMTPTKPARTTTPTAPTGWKLWVAAANQPVRSSPGGSIVGHLPVDAPVTGVPQSNGWARILAGAYAGKYLDGEYVTTSEPGARLASSSQSYTASRPVGTTVTRTVLLSGYSARLHTSPNTSATVAGSVTTGTQLTGSFINSDWFRVTAGAHVGQYIAAGLMQSTASMPAVNGKIAQSSLCSVPASFNTIWEPGTTRYLSCSAEHSLEQMAAAFKAHFGYAMRIDEGYRPLVKQQYFFALWGSPRAAVPGTSNHGLGNAIDLDGNNGSPYVWGSAAHNWLSVHAATYGYQILPGGSEYWHYNYTG